MPNLRNSQWPVVLITALVALLNTPVSFGQSGAYRNLSFTEFSHWLEDKDFLLVNVHVPYQGEIAGTDMLLPYHSVERQQGRLPADKEAKIVVYCLTGPMGHAAATKLAALGYTRVVHYEGGMREWVRSGRNLIYRSEP